MKKAILGSILILLFLASFCLGIFVRKNYFGPIKNQAGRTNFLVLGIRGFDTNDGDLTDTMIFVSLDSKTRRAVLISLPRDLWVDALQAKINTAYHYGGFDLVKKTVSEILGQQIDYLIVIDFESFSKIVDVLGGVEINVQRAFDDFYYPIPGKENDTCNGDKELRCRYEHLHFDAGKQQMDGTTALKFVRSRHAVGEEGTDFARAARQQQLLLAIKQKIFASKLYLHPQKVFQLIKVLQEYLVVDINRWEYGNLAILLTKIDFSQIKTATIGENLLFNPKKHPSGQWVLVPKSGNWKEIQAFVQDLLK